MEKGLLFDRRGGLGYQIESVDCRCTKDKHSTKTCTMSSMKPVINNTTGALLCCPASYFWQEI